MELKDSPCTCLLADTRVRILPPAGLARGGQRAGIAALQHGETLSHAKRAACQKPFGA